MLGKTVLGDMTTLELNCEVENSVTSVGKFLNLMSVGWLHKGLSLFSENIQQNMRG